MSHRCVPALAILLAGSGTVARPLTGQQPSDRAVPPSPVTVASAIAGSFAGVAAGVPAGRFVARAFNVNQYGDAIVSGIVGAGVGSLLGSALGAAWGNGLAGRPPVRFSRRMRDAGVGLLAGALAGYAASRISTPDDGIGWRFGFSIAQGVYVGMSNGRW